MCFPMPSLSVPPAPPSFVTFPSLSHSPSLCFLSESSRLSCVLRPPPLPVQSSPRMDNSQTPPPPGTGKPDDTGKQDPSKASPNAIPQFKRVYSSLGDPDCKQCEGRGEISCPVCAQQGFVSIKMFDTVSTVQCRLCRGKIRVPCPSCKADVYKSVIWWDRIPKDDPEEKWRTDDDGSPRFPWTPPPA